ncbi:MAG: hypothetical protein II702_09730 [Clostridia bacterium]|nr:hypothetical protein [Clostridia bacterium]MBQ4245181.1 hypothetical protein [Clostridia bacterium]
MANKNELLMYKGRPLVRHGKVIYYGFMNEPFVVIMQVMSTREVNGMEVADRVVVQLVNTDPKVVKPREKIVNKTEQRGLYNAMDIATVWLDRKLAQ